MAREDKPFEMPDFTATLSIEIDRDECKRIGIPVSMVIRASMDFIDNKKQFSLSEYEKLSIQYQDETILFQDVAKIDLVLTRN